MLLKISDIKTTVTGELSRIFGLEKCAIKTSSKIDSNEGALLLYEQDLTGYKGSGFHLAIPSKSKPVKISLR